MEYLISSAINGSLKTQRKVWFEDQLVLEATDKTFGKGRIGFGSFDDLGVFRKVAIAVVLS